MDRDELIMALKQYLNLPDDSSLDESYDKESLDSINKVMLVILLEEYSKKEVPIMDLFECNNINDILNLLLNRMGQEND